MATLHDLFPVPTMDCLTRKVCILGAAGVGKSSLASRFLTNSCSDQYLSTVGVKVGSRELSLGDSVVKLVIWDIAGGEAMNDVNANYLRGSGAVLFTADGLRRETLSVALSLHREVSELLGPLPSVLLVNKVDRAGDWEISDSDLRALDRLSLRCLKTSAVTGASVEEAFKVVAIAMCGK